jgi:hypothetical protein
VAEKGKIYGGMLRMKGERQEARWDRLFSLFFLILFHFFCRTEKKLIEQKKICGR